MHTYIYVHTRTCIDVTCCNEILLLSILLIYIDSGIKNNNTLTVT